MVKTLQYLSILLKAQPSCPLAHKSALWAAPQATSYPSLLLPVRLTSIAQLLFLKHLCHQNIPFGWCVLPPDPCVAGFFSLVELSSYVTSSKNGSPSNATILPLDTLHHMTLLYYLRSTYLYGNILFTFLFCLSSSECMLHKGRNCIVTNKSRDNAWHIGQPGFELQHSQ